MDRSKLKWLHCARHKIANVLNCVCLQCQIPRAWPHTLSRCGFLLLIMQTYAHKHCLSNVAKCKGVAISDRKQTIFLLPSSNLIFLREQHFFYLANLWVYCVRAYSSCFSSSICMVFLKKIVESKTSPSFCYLWGSDMNSCTHCSCGTNWKHVIKKVIDHCNAHIGHHFSNQRRTQFRLRCRNHFIACSLCDSRNMPIRSIPVYK